jgi:hypothetical protein
MPYHLDRHSGTPPSVSVIAWNAVRDQLGMGVRDQRNAHCAYPEPRSPFSQPTDQEASMPKGQQRSNKEVKKPKQTKKPLPAGPSGAVIPSGAAAKRGNPPAR